MATIAKEYETRSRVMKETLIIQMDDYLHAISLTSNENEKAKLRLSSYKLSTEIAIHLLNEGVKKFKDALTEEKDK